MSKNAPMLYRQHSSDTHGCQSRALACPNHYALLSSNAFIAYALAAVITRLTRRLTSTAHLAPLLIVPMARGGCLSAPRPQAPMVTSISLVSAPGLPAAPMAREQAGSPAPVRTPVPLPRYDSRKVALVRCCALRRCPTLGHGSTSSRGPSGAGGV